MATAEAARSIFRQLWRDAGAFPKRSTRAYVRSRIRDVAHSRSLSHETIDEAVRALGFIQQSLGGIGNSYRLLKNIERYYDAQYLLPPRIQKRRAQLVSECDAIVAQHVTRVSALVGAPK